MPGNEVGDRVHNFFAQENLSQGQHNSQSLDGNWPLLNNNLWAGSQRPAGVLSSNAKNFSLQQQDHERGQIGSPLHRPHGLSFTQATSRPEFVKSHPQSQQPNLNGFIYGNQFYQNRHDESNYGAVDTNTDQRNLNSRGMSMFGPHQGSGPENQPRPSVRSETSGSPVSFDFFGGQQQMNNQQLSMLQSLQCQQSGLNDMQQQVVLMKMQEIQRLQQLRQVDARQQNMMNQLPSFAKQASGNQSLALINGSLNSDALSYHWTNELGNTNWPQRNSSMIQGASNGLVFSPDHSQGNRVADFVPQQVEQSLYGVPISSSRGSLNQYPHGAMEKNSVQQLVPFGNSLPGGQYNVFPGQVNAQDGISIAKQRFQAENSLRHVSSQSLNAISMDNLQQADPMQRNASMQEFLGRDDVDVPSETLQQKTEALVESSRDDVGLDPTEERILFGSDDNIWAAFGKSHNMGGDGSNPFYSAGNNGFPSIQSGSWSALMQSAVAETSSSDLGLQEEWSGLHIQNTDVPSGSQHGLPCNDGRKQPINLSDDSLPMVSSLNSGVVPSSNDLSMNKNYQSVLGFQQFGGKFSSESGPRLQENSSQGLDQSFNGGGRCSNGLPVHKLVAEGSRIPGNAPHSVHTENKSICSPWSQESTGSRQPSNKPNGWNVFGSGAPYGGDAALMAPGGGNSLQYSQGNDQKQVMHRELVKAGSPWKSNTGQDSTVEMEQLKSSLGSVQVGNEGISLNNVVLPNSVSVRAGEGSSQHVLNNHHLNYWKNVDSVASKASERVGSSLHENKNFSSKEVGRGHELENSDKQENSNDSYRSNLSQHASASGPRENLVSDASDSRNMSAGKQKVSNQVRKNSAPPRKFQYHPMGNLDDDQEAYAAKQPLQSQAISHLGQPKFFGQVPKTCEMGKGQLPDLQRNPKSFNEALAQGSFPGSLPNMAAQFNRLVDTRVPNKVSQPSQNMLELLNKVDQSREHSVLVHANSSEHNASPEVPQAENSDGSVSRLQRSQSNNSQGFGLQLGPPSQRLPNHALSSQSSLQMVSSLHASQTSLEMGQKGQGHLVPTSFLHSIPPAERSQGELKTEISGIPVQAGNETSFYKMSGNMSTMFKPGFPHQVSNLQKQETGWQSGQALRSFEKNASHSTIKEDLHRKPITSQSAEGCLPDESGNIMNNNNVSAGNISQHGSMNVFSEKVLPHASGGESLPVTQSSSIMGLSTPGSSKALPHMWANIAAQQHLLGAQFRKMSSQLPSSFQAGFGNLSSSGSLNQGDQDANKGGNFPPEVVAGTANSQNLGSEEVQSVRKVFCQQALSENSNLAQKISESQGKEPLVRTPSDGSPANSASTQRDIEAFGRSLKPNNLFQQNYSLLNQMQVMKNTENDPSQRVLKRMKGPESGLDIQTPAANMVHSNDPNATTGAVSVPSHSSAPSGDSDLLNVSASANSVERNLSSEHGNVVSQGMFGFGQDVSQSGNEMTCNKVDHTKISPQMAPSWFSQYGTFKNGQVLPMYRAATLKPGEQPFTLGRPSSGLRALNSMDQLAAVTTTDTNQATITQQNPTSVLLPAEHFSSQILPSHVSSQHAVILKSKKRKSTCELNPWHKEISLGSQNLQTMSMAEVVWARAASRLTEKVEEDVDLMEDGQLMLRPRRRLLLATQLMQQLFPAPPAAILSMNANSDYDSVAYSVSRLALGDTCGAVSLANSEFSLSRGGINEPSDVSKPSDRTDDQYLSKAVKEFSTRAKKLETEFFRLDKRASVLDLIVDCQDLEKFSVINRFAKFHGRGQAESADAASSSDAATNTHKPFPQRYVTALPLPRNLPTRVQCLSL